MMNDAIRALQTLAECNFCPGVSFTVKLRSTDGVITTTLPAEEDFEKVFVGEVPFHPTNKGSTQAA